MTSEKIQAELEGFKARLIEHTNVSSVAVVAVEELPRVGTMIRVSMGGNELELATALRILARKIEDTENDEDDED